MTSRTHSFLWSCTSGGDLRHTAKEKRMLWLFFWKQNQSPAHSLRVLWACPNTRTICGAEKVLSAPLCSSLQWKGPRKPPRTYKCYWLQPKMECSVRFPLGEQQAKLWAARILVTLRYSDEGTGKIGGAGERESSGCKHKNRTLTTCPLSSCTLSFNKMFEKPLVSNHNCKNKIKYRDRGLARFCSSCVRNTES